MGWLADLRLRRQRNVFVRHALRTARRAGHPAARYDEDLFCIELDPERRLFLRNVFTLWLEASATERAELLWHFVCDLDLRPPDDFAEARAHLFPRVRSASATSILELELRARGEAFPSTTPRFPITRALEATLAIDFEQSILTMTELPSAWGVSEDEAWEIALENLRSVSTEAFRELAPGLLASPWQDNYDACRICIPDLFEALPLQGAPVVAVPHRDHLLVTGSEHTAGLRAMGARSMQLLTDDRSILGGAFVLRDGRWHPLPTSPDDPATVELHRAYIHDRAGDYEAQKQALEKLYTASGEERFVASFALMREDATGIDRSVTSWTEGVCAAIPRADRVAFVRDPEHPEPEVVIVAWTDAEEVAGRYMTHDPSLYPERYLIDGFPDDAELATLRDRAS